MRPFPSPSSSSSIHLFISIFMILIISSIISITSSEKPYQDANNTQFIRTSCNSTNYPRLCFASLSKHAGFIQTSPVLLTGTALNVTLASAKATSAMMSTLSKSLHGRLKPREAAALRDCVEQLSDSVDELRKSIGEMSELRESNFELTMNDVQTWVSAALTDESTCSDGFEGASMNGNVKNTVRSRIVLVAQLTSNALAFISQLASSHA
ncbi:21 kDa protein [Prosopis cineraria]|uniref:21 kDa protein n=1 Tax=Prosopis cineraria TaxID=364024 RepID=UPI00240F6030|nr:21 kDa protein [Prosopis cineraria]